MRTDQTSIIKFNCEILIPQSKRFSYQAKQDFVIFQNNNNHISNSFTFFSDSLNQLKCDKVFQSEKSKFTPVVLHQDDITENFRIEQEFSKEKNEYLKLFSFLTDTMKMDAKNKKQISFNTKNIIRNICNAQNQYVIFNEEAKQIIQHHLSRSQKFKDWVNRLKFHTFEQFQKLWSRENTSLYHKLYKKLCKKFYIQNAIPYIMNSRIKNESTKLAHIRYLYRFLEGIEDPQNFYYFKSKQEGSIKNK